MVREYPLLLFQVAPFEIIRCDKYDGSTPSPLPFDGNIEQINQQVVENEILPIEKGKVKSLPTKTKKNACTSAFSMSIIFQMHYEKIDTNGRISNLYN